MIMTFAAYVVLSVRIVANSVSRHTSTQQKNRKLLFTKQLLVLSQYKKSVCLNDG